MQIRRAPLRFAAWRRIWTCSISSPMSIQDSGHFDYDSNLDAFYDYEKYGQQRIQQEQGIFTERGYIAYQGTLSLDELMRKEPAEQYQRERDESMEMGGLS